MIASGSLTGRLSRYVIAGVALVWLASLMTTALVLRSEEDEMLDKALLETAHVFLPVLERDYRQRIEEGGRPPFDIASPKPTEMPPDPTEADEVLLYRLLDDDGRVLMSSRAPAGAELPPGPPQAGYHISPTHVFFTTAANADGFVVEVGDLRLERSEAFWDSFVTLLLPMIAILPLAYLLVGWIARAALAPLKVLQDEIAGRGDSRLDPIDATGQPDELAAITATLNGFMTRLAQSLDGERAFATNAAHELRTPVAIALAQVQRLRVEATGATVRSRIDRVEEALKRMSRLVARLLQLARAESGIGRSDVTQDAAKLLEFVLRDQCGDQAKASRLVVSLPQSPVPTPMDADAFAIVAGNLIDNAVQHSPADTPVEVSLSDDGVLSISNESPIVPVQKLEKLTRRFERSAVKGDGFGLGLYISDRLARQAGGSLTLRSRSSLDGDRFEAVFLVPAAGQ